jgi:hypothetical protein
MRQTKGYSRAAYRALWLERVQAWQHSGLNKSQFAQQNGYPLEQLCDWIARAQKQLTPPNPAEQKLIPIHITAHPVQIRITLDHVQCDFFNQPDPQWLAQCLRALQP